MIVVTFLLTCYKSSVLTPETKLLNFNKEETYSFTGASLPFIASF